MIVSKTGRLPPGLDGLLGLYCWGRDASRTIVTTMGVEEGAICGGTGGGVVAVDAASSPVVGDGSDVSSCPSVGTDAVAGGASGDCSDSLTISSSLSLVSVSSVFGGSTCTTVPFVVSSSSTILVTSTSNQT